MPASRSVRATTLIPRSWPSNPILATSTRQVTGASRDGAFGPGTEHVLQRGSDLAHGDVRVDRVEDRRNQVHGGIGRVASDAGDGGADALVVALTLHPRQPLQLTVLDRGIDA